MIVKDEQKVLSRCLDCVKEFADEIIIVDTGSVDDTIAIAKKYTDKVFEFVWCDDFAKARNFSFDKASCDYLMWIDADDIVEQDSIKKLQQLKNELNIHYIVDEIKHIPNQIDNSKSTSIDKKKNSIKNSTQAKEKANNIPTILSTDMVVCRYHLGFDQNDNPTFYSSRERIVRRLSGYRWNGAVHECIPIAGNVLYREDISIRHKNEHKDWYKSNLRNIRIYETLLNTNGFLDARGLYYYSRELRDGGRYIEAIFYLKQFLDGKKGWNEDNIGACLIIAEIYRDRLKDINQAMQNALQTMRYDALRAETACFLGKCCQLKNDYATATDWYLLATQIKPKGMGFINKDYNEYIPQIELAVCYDKLGDHSKANEYNEKAGKIKPESQAYIQNKHYFSQLKKENKCKD